MNRTSRLRGAGVGLGVAVGAVASLVTASVAMAHPFGEPQTIRLSAQDNQVLVRWTAPADDLRMLGGALGAFPEQREFVLEPGADPTPVGGSEADLVLGSDEVANYLADHVEVRQGGVACDSTVTLDGLFDAGALVTFECPDEVRDVEVEVTTLVDFNEAYSTAAIGDASDPGRWLYTADDPIRRWTFDAAASTDNDADSGGSDSVLLSAFDEGSTLPLALLIAAVVGAAHGLAPGHGKTVSAAYLIGTHARRRHAVALAGIVAAMHSASVLALGVMWWLLVDDGPVPVESVTRWAQVGVGAAVLATGMVITRRRWREHRGHNNHGHDPHGPPSGVEPWSRAGLAGIASAGGLLPSPSAFLVLIGGLLTGRGWFAVAMVLAFGVGLAVTVLAAGMLTITGRDWLARRAERHGTVGRGQRLSGVVARLPLLAGVAVVVGGCVISIQAVAFAW